MSYGGSALDDAKKKAKQTKTDNETKEIKDKKQKKKKRKRERETKDLESKKTKTNASNETTSTETTRPERGDEDYAQMQSIEYLELWHEDKDHWKFNKNRQVWLLQNMFHPSSIDKTSFKILLKYLEGLKGAARQTTLRQAQAILEEGVAVVVDTSEVIGVDAAVVEKHRKSTEKLRRIRYGRADALARILA